MNEMRGREKGNRLRQLLPGHVGFRVINMILLTGIMLIFRFAAQTKSMKGQKDTDVYVLLRPAGPVIV